jgi:hypothetical protein
MRRACQFKLAVAITGCVAALAPTAFAFEGRINAVVSQGTEPTPLRYTVGTNFLRIEVTTTNWPNPVDIMDRNSGALTLLFPHNRSYVRLKSASETSSAPPGLPQMPSALPPGVGPQLRSPSVPVMPNLPTSPGTPGNLPPGIGPTNVPGIPVPPRIPRMPERPAMPTAPAGLPPGVGPQASVPGTSGATPHAAGGTPALPMLMMPNPPAAGGMPSMTAMPMMPMMGEAMELEATGEKTNLLGYACEKFEIKQRGETMEIWATDGLLPFQNYVRNQPPRFGPRMIEEQWAGLVTAKKLFPLRASLHFEEGAEQYRFEVQSITPQKLTEEDLKLFLPPDGYFEIQPLPF